MRAINAELCLNVQIGFQRRYCLKFSRMLALYIFMNNTRGQQLFLGCLDDYKYHSEPLNHTHELQSSV